MSPRLHPLRAGARHACVIDGDTFKLGERKVRIIGIDAPETHPARCAEEARLGEAATAKLQQLLNQGPFEMVAPIYRDMHDRYGRDLRADPAQAAGRRAINRSPTTCARAAWRIAISAGSRPGGADMRRKPDERRGADRAGPGAAEQELLHARHAAFGDRAGAWAAQCARRS